MPVNKITRHKTVTVECPMDMKRVTDYFGKYNTYTLSLCNKNCYKKSIDDNDIVNEFAALIHSLEQKIKSLDNVHFVMIIDLTIKNLNNLLRFLHFLTKIDTVIISYISTIITEIKLFSKIINYFTKINENDDMHDILLAYTLLHFPINLIGIIANTYNVAIELDIVNKKFYRKIIKKQNDCPIQLSIFKENVTCLTCLTTQSIDNENRDYINQLLLQMRSLYLISKNSCNYIISDFINFLNYEVQILVQNTSIIKQKIFNSFLLFDTTRSLTIPMQNIGILARKLKNQRIKYGASQKSIFNSPIKEVCQC